MAQGATGIACLVSNTEYVSSYFKYSTIGSNTFF